MNYELKKKTGNSTLEDEGGYSALKVERWSSFGLCDIESRKFWQWFCWEP